MAGLTARNWRSWAEGSLNPLLERPRRWDATDSHWDATDYGTVGSPTTWLVEGLIRWPAQSRPTFRVDAFVLPLYLPTAAPYGKWLVSLKSESGGRAFDKPTPEMKERVARDIARAANADGLPFLAQVGVRDGFLDHVRSAQARTLSERGAFAHGEEVGYTEILLGNYDAAAEQLVRQSRDEDDDADWQTESRRRAAHVLSLLRAGPELAHAELSQWADQTATNLGVSRIAHHPT